ncbi:alpha/beta fold hydrolase [Nocardioides alcanivorans]|uniref:alpha/beta fold hydrolase n=1 Tax=Nocardioides alcanivorans TaxID=2897352 RepID=UPI001F418F0E|nr:alpha/beta hydrolase [Nocardioides alcanivorans]
MRRGYVDSTWGQVHYRAAGEHGPLVVLFHESPLSSKVFEEVLPLLAPHCRAVAFDTPGYGASDPPPTNGFEIPDYADVLSGAIRALYADPDDLIVGGVHTGASIAVEVARLHADQVRGAVLSGVALYTPDERAEKLASWAPQPQVDLAGSQFDWAVERYNRIWPGLTPAMLQLAVVDVMSVVDRYNWGYNAAFRHDPAPALAAITSPVLLLDAEFDLLADKDAAALETAPAARLVSLPGLHGQPHLRAPEEYARHLVDFVEEVAR